MDPIRISPQEAYKKAKEGEAIFVCGYEDDAKFKTLRLEMAISFSEFLKKLPSLSKDQEIIFYCAWHKEATAAGQAAKYSSRGYKNVKVLAGGVEGWKKAGYKQL